MLDAAWSRSPAEVLSHFDVNPATGLSSEHASKNAEIYGKNGSCLESYLVLYLVH